MQPDSAVQGLTPWQGCLAVHQKLVLSLHSVGLSLVGSCAATGISCSLLFKEGRAARSHQWSESRSDTCHFLSEAFQRQDSLSFSVSYMQKIVSPYFSCVIDKETESHPGLASACCLSAAPSPAFRAMPSPAPPQLKCPPAPPNPITLPCCHSAFFTALL